MCVDVHVDADVDVDEDVFLQVFVSISHWFPTELSKAPAGDVLFPSPPSPCRH